jgi:hypothetical protein
MSTWVAMFDRIIPHIRIPIPPPRPQRVRHDTIRRQEPSHARIVIPRPQENQPRRVSLFPGVAEDTLARTGLRQDVAERIKGLAQHQGSGGINQLPGAAQPIRQVIVPGCIVLGQTGQVYVILTAAAGDLWSAASSGSRCRM